jgi:cytochrome oxidase assembly protein ShyY1
VRTFILAPRWLALHLAAIVLVTGFGALGWWQLEVFRDSQARQELRELPPVPVDELAHAGTPLGAAAERSITASGRYLTQVTVPARIRDGVLGTYDFTPFETDSGILAVVRGWSSSPDALPAAPSGEVTVTGHLLPPETPGHATGGTLTDSEVGYLAPEPVAAAIGADVADFYAGYVILADESPAPAVAPERLELDVLAPIRNVSVWQNLSYWAQWWVFAGAVVVFWASFVRAGVKRSRAEQRQVPDGQAEPSPRPSAPR